MRRIRPGKSSATPGRTQYIGGSDSGARRASVVDTGHEHRNLKEEGVATGERGRGQGPGSPVGRAGEAERGSPARGPIARGAGIACTYTRTPMTMRQSSTHAPTQFSSHPPRAIGSTSGTRPHTGPPSYCRVCSPIRPSEYAPQGHGRARHSHSPYCAALRASA